MANRLVVGLAVAGLLAVGWTASRAQAADAASLEQIIEQQRGLRAQLDRGETAGLSPRRVRVVRQAQDQVFRLTEGKTQLDQLNIEQRVQLENALEVINAEVVGTRVARENRDVCWTEARSGSKLKATRCGTQEEIDEARRGARAWMEKPRICSGPGCG